MGAAVSPRWINVGGIAVPVGGGGDTSKILDETFDTDFANFEAPGAEWLANADLSPFSIVSGVARMGVATECALVFDATVKHSLQVVTLRVGAADAANRMRLKSRVIPGEATALDLNWISHTSGTQGLRMGMLDDGSFVAASTATRVAAAGSYYALMLLTMGERAFGGVFEVDSTSKNVRGENTSAGVNTPVVGTNDTFAGWPAEINEDQPGGAFMLSSTGSQNTGSPAAEFLRWEIWDLGD
jgi:hypothetical protein